jgi:ABC-type polysaccharide/polyol phosphate export permease
MNKHVALLVYLLTNPARTALAETSGMVRGLFQERTPIDPSNPLGLILVWFVLLAIGAFVLAIFVQTIRRDILRTTKKRRRK